MSNGKAISTLIELKSLLPQLPATPVSALSIPYRQVVRKLIYVASGTQLDIVFATSIVFKHFQAFNTPHLDAIKRILYYLQGTLHYGLVFNPNGQSKLTLKDYSNADWAKDATNRKSTSSYLFMLKGAQSHECPRSRTLLLYLQLRPSTLPLLRVPRKHSGLKAFFLTLAMLKRVPPLSTKTIKVALHSQGTLCSISGPNTWMCRHTSSWSKSRAIKLCLFTTQHNSWLLTFLLRPFTTLNSSSCVNWLGLFQSLTTIDFDRGYHDIKIIKTLSCLHF